MANLNYIIKLRSHSGWLDHQSSDPFHYNNDFQLSLKIQFYDKVSANTISYYCQFGTKNLLSKLAKQTQVLVALVFFYFAFWTPFNHHLAVKSSITGKKGRNTRRRPWRGSPISGRGFKSILEEEEWYIQEYTAYRLSKLNCAIGKFKELKHSPIRQRRVRNLDRWFIF